MPAKSGAPESSTPTAAQAGQFMQADASPAELLPTAGQAPAAAPPKVVLDPDKLNMLDVMRARKMFAALPSADPWSGRDPWSLLAGVIEERDALIIWCVRSRTDPTFTWEQACLLDFGELEPAEGPPPPPTPEPSPNGSPKSSGPARSV